MSGPLFPTPPDCIALNGSLHLLQTAQISDNCKTEGKVVFLLALPRPAGMVWNLYEVYLWVATNRCGFAYLPQRAQRTCHSLVGTFFAHTTGHLSKPLHETFAMQTPRTVELTVCVCVCVSSLFLF